MEVTMKTMGVRLLDAFRAVVTDMQIFVTRNQVHTYIIINSLADRQFHTESFLAQYKSDRAATDLSHFMKRSSALTA